MVGSCSKNQMPDGYLLAPTSTVAHRAKRAAIEVVGPTPWLLQQIQPCLVIRLHRANDVGNLSAHLRCMTSSRLMIAHHVTATRPMDRRVEIFLFAMRRAKKWNSDSVTRTIFVACVLKWITFQAPTEKATVKTESKNGCGAISQVSGHAENGSGFPLAR